jgi:hypothetical protein
MNIKEQFKQIEKLYHFTSFDTALKIIESNRLRFGRLSNTNDIHEVAKNMFVDTNGQPIDKFPSDVLNALYDEVYKYRQISLTIDDKENDKYGFDLHQMWGLYADKGEGVCLVFDKKEIEKSWDWAKIQNGPVCYDKSQELESFVVSRSHNPEAVLDDVRSRLPDIFFHKRKEWEHEQEYRLLKRCPNPTKEEYLCIYQALKFVILTSKLRNVDEVRYFKAIDTIKEKVKKAGAIHVLVYGNGLFDYALCTEDGAEELWNSNDGYNVLILDDNCKLAI